MRLKKKEGRSQIWLPVPGAQPGTWPLRLAGRRRESEPRRPRGLWPLHPDRRAASRPRRLCRPFPQRPAKGPHLLVQIARPGFSRNLKARRAVPRGRNGLSVRDRPGRSGSLRSGPAAEGRPGVARRALRPGGGRAAGGAAARGTSRGQPGSGTRSGSRGASSCRFRGSAAPGRHAPPPGGLPSSPLRRDDAASARHRHLGPAPRISRRIGVW